MASLPASLYILEGTYSRPRWYLIVSMRATRLWCSSERYVLFGLRWYQNLLWIFNFHPTNSYTDYRVGVELAGEYQVVLDSDNKEFDGQGRIDSSGRYFTTDFRWNNRSNFLQGTSSPDRPPLNRQCTSRLALHLYSQKLDDSRVVKFLVSVMNVWFAKVLPLQKPLGVVTPKLNRYQLASWERSQSHVK